uniref:Deacetoxyvindoline 4-hydroxylase n=1 Tax=Aegilops tauschii TaxID=37682 RepID=N1QR76_AEGTA
MNNALFEYADHVKNLGNTLFKLLSEALGLEPSHLADIECNQGQVFLCHYYPPCPQSELAIEAGRHSEGGFLTILLQGESGDLQIFNEDQWVDVTPMPRAFIVNIGDLLKFISNGGFWSVEHRILVKNVAPRVSVAYFFGTHIDPTLTRIYSSIKELVFDENQLLYRETLAIDYIKHYYSIGLDAITTI